MHSADAYRIRLYHQRLLFRTALFRPVLAKADDLPGIIADTGPPGCFYTGDEPAQGTQMEQCCLPSTLACIPCTYTGLRKEHMINLLGKDPA